MIRVVLAVILTVVLVGIAMPAIDHAAGVNSDRRVGSVAEQFERTAVELTESEDLPPRGVRGPQRVLDVTFPTPSLTATAVLKFRIERQGSTNHSVLTYRVGGRPERTRQIDAPVVNADDGTLKLGRVTGDRSYVLRLGRGPADDPIVRVHRGGG
ncbi:DUF7311 family protein [Halosimplex pelagicum]|uniref:DUF7311 domain-containing protein n=1 Tax=Halosimplex pelagicum TaxID=869886 RepID=A0A7D5TS12_9EURY|nr:hypothetical protein [Halosimplex pelagicum]QLH80154.1 hypothetical protein HZS54_00290 [Halosimplex pelagicum]